MSERNLPKTVIAVISDLHVGSAARALDLNPRPQDSRYAEKAYIESFETFARNKGLKADMLVVPGDITNRASPDEFRLASTQLPKLAQALGVSRERIVFVPGNHDVDWKVLELDPGDKSDFRLRQRYQPLEQQECIFSEILSRAVQNKITASECFCIWNFEPFLVVGVNSAYHDGPNDKVHHGLVPAHVLEALAAELGAYPRRKEQIRVAVVHHHPLQYSDPVSSEPDFSAMTNAQAFLTLLEEHEFDVVIHGHKHTPNFNVWQVSSYFQLPILGAGSFSYLLDSRWNGLVNNQFHLLEFHDRDEATGRALGVLRSFTYLTGHGWTPSRRGNGIEHEIYFGGLGTESELRDALRGEITERFASAEYIRLASVFSERADLRYVAAKLVRRVLGQLATEMSFVVHDSDPSNVLLLRE